MESFRLFVGCYTEKLPHVPDGCGRGIMSVCLEQEGGTLRIESGPHEVEENPTWICARSCGRRIYVVNEREKGRVASYSVLGEDGSLSLLEEKPTFGEQPVHCELSRNERHLSVCNYSNGSTTVCLLGEEGDIRSVLFPFSHSTVSDLHLPGPNELEQSVPHAHQARFAGDSFLFVADKGCDRMFCFSVPEPSSDSSDSLVHVDERDSSFPRGCGPRHIGWHPFLPVMYVVGELDCHVHSFSFDHHLGTIRETIESVSVLPDTSNIPADKRENFRNCAHIEVHPNGKFLFVSIRGFDLIATIALDDETGRMLVSSHTPTGGRTPRNFALSPDGQWLVVANQDSHSLVSFSIDCLTGCLTQRDSICCLSPAVVCFSPILSKQISE